MLLLPLYINHNYNNFLGIVFGCALHFLGFFTGGLLGLFAGGLLGGDCGGLLALPAEGWNTAPEGFEMAPDPGGFGGGGPRPPPDTVPIGPISFGDAPDPSPARLLEPAIAASAASSLTRTEELAPLLEDEDVAGLVPKPTLLLDPPLEMMSPVMSDAGELPVPSRPDLDLVPDALPALAGLPAPLLGTGRLAARRRSMLASRLLRRSSSNFVHRSL